MAEISKITALDGTTYDIKDATARSSIPEAAAATPSNLGTAAVGSSSKYAREDHVHNKPSAADIGAVATTGNETVAGNKTFSGTTTISADSVYPASTGTIVPANAAAIIQSPIPKYLWHDLFGFCYVTTPAYQTTTDGTNWTDATLEKRLFIHRNGWGKQSVISDTISGSRWTWTSNSFSYSSGSWLAIGFGYTQTPSYFDLLFEGANSNDEWTTLLSVTNKKYSSTPIWFKTSTPSSYAKIRLTIKRNSEDQTTNAVQITSICWLATRWGDQGGGSEREFPYVWDGTPNIYPISDNTQTLGTSSYNWKDVYTKKLNGTTVPSSPKFTDTNYVPSGGTAGQVLMKNSSTNYDVTWGTGGSGVYVGTSEPSDPNINVWVDTDGPTDTFVKSVNGQAGDVTVDTLPAVTSSDNGKILAVVNGAWAAQTLSQWQGGNY